MKIFSPGMMRCPKCNGQFDPQSDFCLIWDETQPQSRAPK
jgi:hypothetical protein